MKSILIASIIIAVLSSTKVFAEDCTNTDKATISWKRSCKVHLVVEKNGSGKEYKGDPCGCAADVFDMEKLADDKNCNISASDVLTVFQNEKFRARCLE